MSNPNLPEYYEWIIKLTEQLDKLFESQKEYIKCSSGCSICCQTGYYPITELEFDLMKVGFSELPEEQRIEIQKKSLELYKERKRFLNNDGDKFDFFYPCLFLKEDKCSIYPYRAIICRTHGLIAQNDLSKNKFSLPFCVNDGLNYSNVWDSEKKEILYDKIEKIGLKTKPKSFDIGYEKILKTIGHLNPGDIRMLFEWIILDMKDHETLLAEINKDLENEFAGFVKTGN